MRAAAHDAWQKELSRVTIETTNQKQKQIFYTALYHTMLAPTLFDDVDGQYRGMDLEDPPAAAGRAQLQHLLALGHLSRPASALHPHASTARSRTRELPDPHGRREPRRHAGLAAPGPRNRLHDRLPFRAGPRRGLRQGLPGHRLSSASILSSGSVPWTTTIAVSAYYRKLGYIPSDKEEESATKTLEYSYDDWAVAQIARKLGPRGRLRGAARTGRATTAISGTRPPASSARASRTANGPRPSTPS